MFVDDFLHEVIYMIVLKALVVATTEYDGLFYSKNTFIKSNKLSFSENMFSHDTNQ